MGLLIKATNFEADGANMSSIFEDTGHGIAVNKDSDAF